MKKNTVLLSLEKYNDLRSLEIINEMQEDEISELKAEIRFLKDVDDELDFEQEKTNETKETEKVEQKPETNESDKSQFDKNIEDVARQIAIDITETLEKLAETRRKKKQEGSIN